MTTIIILILGSVLSIIAGIKFFGKKEIKEYPALYVLIFAMSLFSWVAFVSWLLCFNEYKNKS
jgi:hypothetical protein